MDAKELTHALAGHCGTSQYHRGIFNNLKWTDGIQDMCNKAGAFWLMDLIAGFELEQPILKKESFQLWRMISWGSNGGTLLCEDGNGTKLMDYHIKYTDFPEGEFEFYVVDGVALLKSEY